uniref:Pecanex-like protein n=1 Tax=Steinernema glaseri TaxID=37863 RepID=A0A1I7ZP36_9BILA
SARQQIIHPVRLHADEEDEGGGPESSGPGGLRGLINMSNAKTTSPSDRSGTTVGVGSEKTARSEC